MKAKGAFWVVLALPVLCLVIGGLLCWKGFGKIAQASGDPPAVSTLRELEQNRGSYVLVTGYMQPMDKYFVRRSRTEYDYTDTKYYFHRLALEDGAILFVNGREYAPGWYRLHVDVENIDYFKQVPALLEAADGVVGNMMLRMHTGSGGAAYIAGGVLLLLLAVAMLYGVGRGRRAGTGAISAGL